MQRVKSAKVVLTARGAARSFQQTTGTAVSFDRDQVVNVAYQSTAGHTADASKLEAISRGANGTRTRSTQIAIGRMSYLKSENLDVAPSNVPSVIPPGLWRPFLNADSLVFPDTSFGKLGQFYVQKSDNVPQTQFVIATNTGTAMTLTASGSLIDSSQSALRGSFTDSLEVSPTTMLWSTWERTRTYQDGASYTEKLVFSDYDAPNQIERPITNSASRFVADGSAANPEVGDLVVRICVRTSPTPYVPAACDASRPLGGLALTLQQSGTNGRAFADGITSAVGVVEFAAVPIYVDYQLIVGCGPTGKTNVAVAAGSVNAGGRTFLDFAVC